jgi:hypothetical protein
VQWGEDELRGMSIEAATSMNIPPAKAARIVSKIK